MKGSNGTNPAAGFRRLGARSHARLLDDQTESVARTMRADERVVAIARLLGELHADLRAAERHMISANERASAAHYQAPDSLLLAVA
jgi:hypothetical protein